MKQEHILMLVPVVVLVMMMFLLAGTGEEDASLDMPADRDWFDAPSDMQHAGTPVVSVDESETAAFFQERFRDHGPDAQLQLGGMRHDLTTRPAMSPMSPQMNQDMRNDRASREREREGRGRAEASESSGWGWLADDVQQRRSRTRGTGRDTDREMFPRRMDDQDDGVLSRRWFDE